MNRTHCKLAAQLIAAVVILSIGCTSMTSVAAPPAKKKTTRATPAELAAAIEKGKKFLYGEQKNGHWETKEKADNAQDHIFGGLTALATYALLASGDEPQNSPQLQQAVKFLEQAEIFGIYSLGLRCQVWHLLFDLDPKNQTVKDCIKKDANSLYQAAMKNQIKGMFRYNLESTDYDHSCSQYGVLGLWAMEQCGAELPEDLWKAVEEAWVKHQDKDGSWAYQADGQGTPNMTAAGVATLFITQDFVNAMAGINCDGGAARPSALAIDKGLKWMGEHYKDVNNLYGWYGVERIGVASGYKFFGTVDWFAEVSGRLVAAQKEDGSWSMGGYAGSSAVADTSFAVLFLSRGGAPVVMNKLEYQIGGKLANWNQRPRDSANAVKFLGDVLERDLNWQIVNLNVPVEDLHDAPILYIAGNQELKFTPEEEAKLKLYVEQGGMILGNANCKSKPFADSFTKLGGKLFPDCDNFRNIPKDHVLYTRQQYPRVSWATGKIPGEVLGLTNGARELMMLISTEDVAEKWQRQQFKSRKEDFELIADIFNYAEHVKLTKDDKSKGAVKKDDEAELQMKGFSHIIMPDKDVTATSKIKVARIEYKGNWNPEPGGFRRLAAWMHNQLKTDLDVESVKLGTAKLNKATYPAAHFTGIGRLVLSASEKAELKDYANSGGTLIADATAGDEDFRKSMDSLMAELWPGGSLDTLPVDHPIYAAGEPIKSVRYRNFARTVGLGGGTKPHLKAWMVNGKPRMIFSPEDLTVSLVGNPVDGIAGYDPKSALPVMGDVIVWASAGGAGAAAAAPAPADQPASRPVAPK